MGGGGGESMTNIIGILQEEATLLMILENNLLGLFHIFSEYA